MRPKRFKSDVTFEETVADDWAHNLDVAEVPLSSRPLLVLGAFLFLSGAILIGRVLALGLISSHFYAARASANANQLNRIPAPRGIIADRTGMPLAQNRPVFSVLLDIKEFLRHPELQRATFSTLQEIVGLSEADIWSAINEHDVEKFPDPVVLVPDIEQGQALRLKAIDSPVISVVDTYAREYPQGSAFSTVLGYTSLITAGDLEKNPGLSSRDIIGKSGVEMFYDDQLRGQPGVISKLRNARGTVLTEQEKQPPEIGQTLALTIDGEFQKYFVQRVQQGLQALGRSSGVAMAMDPQTGEVLALANFPTFDNNVFVRSGTNKEKAELLTSSQRPLFDRAISGLYAPGSTIKPLMGVAALKEGVIDPGREIFSPGYLDIPNPYNPDKPTRYLDWRYQGNVNLAYAIAQSSDVYFYEVGGGFAGIPGLGISRIREWWQKFNLGTPTGIDLPGEGKGFLPSPEWKEKTQNKPWLLGDTFNISIGQGDLLVTPVQLLTYISGLANGNKLYKPYLAKDVQSPTVLADFSDLAGEIKEVQKGMRLTVTSPQGTAYLLHDLPIPIAGKTGSAQIHNNTKENAFFTGYNVVTGDQPQVAILILVEESKEGSLNTIPIARDVFRWWWDNRVNKK